MQRTSSADARLDRMVALYLSEVVPGNWPLSVSESAKALKALSRDGDLKIEALTPILERMAVERGLNVHFDGEA
jgi:hypothetical protein